MQLLRLSWVDININLYSHLNFISFFLVSILSFQVRNLALCSLLKQQHLLLFNLEKSDVATPVVLWSWITDSLCPHIFMLLGVFLMTLHFDFLLRYLSFMIFLRRWRPFSYKRGNLSFYIYIYIIQLIKDEIKTFWC